MMLRAIRQFFEDNIQSVAGKATDPEQALRLATAALLVEVTRADHEVDERERSAVAESVRHIFDLDPQQTQELVRLAEQEAKQATSLFQFTSLIDKHFSVEQKKRVLEMLWRVAYADAHKDKHEEHLVRKVADLLHLSEVDFAYTRHKVEEEMKK
ncbi:MAG: TerB family tellurite resistance protein [Gammaproteobacteria bacterium]|nr:TerB family tellurite resistance protein [Gammaproteobacteria bacterium]